MHTKRFQMCVVCVVCMCVCVQSARKRTKSKAFIQHSGHMATRPLRTATKTTNLSLSAQARIEAIEYDRYCPHRRRPRGQQELWGTTLIQAKAVTGLLPPTSVSAVIKWVPVVSSTQEIGPVQLLSLLSLLPGGGYRWRRQGVADDNGC